MSSPSQRDGVFDHTGLANTNAGAVMHNVACAASCGLMQGSMDRKLQASGTWHQSQTPTPARGTPRQSPVAQAYPGHATRCNPPTAWSSSPRSHVLSHHCTLSHCALCGRPSASTTVGTCPTATKTSSAAERPQGTAGGQFSALGYSGTDACALPPPCCPLQSCPLCDGSWSAGAPLPT